MFLILFLPDTLSSRRIRSVAGYALSVFGEHEKMRLSVFGRKKPAGYAQFTPDTLSSRRIRSVYAGYAQSELIRRLRKHPPDTLSWKKTKKNMKNNKIFIFLLGYLIGRCERLSKAF